MNLKINRHNLFLIVITSLLFLSCLFQISFFSYVDELIALVSIIYIAVETIFKRKDQLMKINFVFVVLLFILGITSNIVYNYQYSWFLVLEDVFMFLKPFAVFVAIYSYFKNSKQIENFHRYSVTIAKVLTVVVFIGLLISYTFNLPTMAFYDSWATFKFLKIYVFTTGYPGYLAVFLGVLVTILLTEHDNKRIKIYIFMDLVSIVCTQSGIGFIAVFLYILFVVINSRKKLKWYHIILLAVGGVAVGWNEIYWYLLNSTAARSVMLRYGFITAQNLFPLGSGFSTYGGAIAARHYAKLYSHYNFGLYWGLAENGDMDFLHDCYYPYIIGQFGFIGTLVYGWYEFSLFNWINRLKENKNIRAALMFAFVLILVMNLGQGGFGGAIGCLYMIFMAFYMKKIMIEKNESNFVLDKGK